MSEMQNLNDYYKSRKGYAGYTETIRQYTGTGENIVENLHSNNHMNFHTHDFFEINYIKKQMRDEINRQQMAEKEFDILRRAE